MQHFKLELLAFKINYGYLLCEVTFKYGVDTGNWFIVKSVQSINRN